MLTFWESSLPNQQSMQSNPIEAAHSHDTSHGKVKVSADGPRRFLPYPVVIQNFLGT